MTPLHVSWPLTALLCLCTSPLHAQSNDKPKPIDKMQLMTAAIARNGLGEDPSSPWHVRASFETFDDKGQHSGGGIFEEWWLGPKNYKTVYTTDSFNQTDVATAEGLFRSGDQKWASASLAAVQMLLIKPLSRWRYDPSRNDLSDSTRKVGKIKLRCLILSSKDSENAWNPSLCFDPDSPVLRSSSDTTVFNDVLPFHSHFFARDIDQTSEGKNYRKIHVLSMESLPADTTAFTVPADSTGPLKGPIELPSGRVNQISDSPHLDASLLDTGVTKLSVKLIIGKDGHVLEATPMEGPPKVAGSLASALRKAIFEPFMILDTPVEVETIYERTIKVARSATFTHY